MDLQVVFSDDELESIVEEAAVYMCACPGQVASELRSLRRLIRYQRDCMQNLRNNTEVHSTIEASALQAHRALEQCLMQVLEIEGWDRATLKMPAGLRQLRATLLDESL
ncbi:hypothetical protein RQP54_12115 [Curvibacter sp. APW13]|uniref:hypothetical protein n=1 Tax=Curvibacter sp. APW13 TaxID=3077236 RepID=UPI0028E03475|nr:hypothetical protein [Curvibacter sp. APW13]MDT8991606.1 hypothetical protein [Curvibacter sp. APW13]